MRSNEAKATWNSSSSRTVLPSLLLGWRRVISQQQRTTSGTTSSSEVVLSFNDISREWKAVDSRSLAKAKHHGVRHWRKRQVRLLDGRQASVALAEKCGDILDTRGQRRKLMTRKKLLERATG